MDVQARIIYELKIQELLHHLENHWLLFTFMIEATSLEFTGECDKERLTYGVRKFRMNGILEMQFMQMVRNLM